MMGRVAGTLNDDVVESFVTAAVVATLIGLFVAVSAMGGRSLLTLASAAAVSGVLVGIIALSNAVPWPAPRRRRP